MHVCTYEYILCVNSAYLVKLLDLCIPLIHHYIPLFYPYIPYSTTIQILSARLLS